MDSQDQKFRPLYELSKKVYLDLKNLKSMMAIQQGGSNQSDESYRPLYVLSKSIYLNMQKLHQMKKSLGVL